MKKLALAVMLVLSGTAYANSGGEGENTGCNGQGNPSSPCENSGTTPSNDSWQTQAQHQGQFQGQAQLATAISDNRNTNSNVNSNENTNANVNHNRAESSVGNVNASIASDAVSVTYSEARNAPSMGQGSFAISGCAVGGNAGGSNTSGSAFLGFGWTPLECYKFMLAQAYQAIGEKQAVCDILRKTKAGEALIKEGVELPTCEPEIIVTATCNTEDCAEAAKAAAEAVMDERMNRMRRVWQEQAEEK